MINKSIYTYTQYTDTTHIHIYIIHAIYIRDFISFHPVALPFPGHHHYMVSAEIPQFPSGTKGK